MWPMHERVYLYLGDYDCQYWVTKYVIIANACDFLIPDGI